MTYDTLWAKYHKRAILLALLGDYTGTQLLRVAHAVWDTFPALFPEVATAVLECDSPRTAAWCIAEMTKDMVGTWDIWVDARRIAYTTSA